MLLGSCWCNNNSCDLHLGCFYTGIPLWDTSEYVYWKYFGNILETTLEEFSVSSAKSLHPFPLFLWNHPWYTTEFGILRIRFWLWCKVLARNAKKNETRTGALCPHSFHAAAISVFHDFINAEEPQFLHTLQFNVCYLLRAPYFSALAQQQKGATRSWQWGGQHKGSKSSSFFLAVPPAGLGSLDFRARAVLQTHLSWTSRASQRAWSHPIWIFNNSMKLA